MGFGYHQLILSSCSARAVRTTIKERAFTLVDRPWAVERPYAILVLPLVDATRSFCVGWHRKASSAPGDKPAPGRARSHKYAGRRVRPYYLDDVA